LSSRRNIGRKRCSNNDCLLSIRRNVSCLDGSAFTSLNAELISNSIVLQAGDVNVLVSSFDLLQVDVGDGNCGKVETVGLVVLVGDSDVSDDELSVSHTKSLSIRRSWRQNVSSDSSASNNVSALR